MAFDYKKIIRSRSARLEILRLLSFIPDKTMLQIQYRIKTGRKLNLKNPQRFTEKLQWYKLYYKNPLMIKCVDKYDVREYVRSKGLGEILIPCYGVYDSADDVDWDALPEQFVMKDTLGGGGVSVAIVRDKSKADIEELKKKAAEWTKIDAHKIDAGREWPYYSGKKHRILIEKYLDSNPYEGGLVDYKFFCFNGNIACVYVIADRELSKGVGLGIYDPDFKKTNVLRVDEHPLKRFIEKPDNYEDLKKVAECLSSEFPEARIDLYNIDGEIRFGEITFYDGSGYMTFEPDSFDYQLGEKFRLPAKKLMGGGKIGLVRIVYLIFVLIFISGLNKDHFLSMIVATIISYIVVTIYGVYVQRSEWKFWRIGDSKNFDYKRLYLYSAPYIISMGVTTIFQAIDKMSLNYYCSYSEVGVYASANNIVNIFSIIQSTFNALWAPIVIEHYLKDPGDKSLYKKGNQLITVIMFFIGATLILGKDIFVLLLGESYRSAAYIIPFLIFYPIMYTISETTVIGIVFYRKSNMQIVVAVISCITNIVGNMILVPKLGGRGAAISTGLSYIVFFLARTLISNHYYYINWNLKNFFTLTIIMIGYAYYNTFYDNVFVNVIWYCLIIIVIYILYKDAIMEGIRLGKKQMEDLISKRS